MRPVKPISLTHWGPFEADIADGRLVATRPWADSGADPDMIGAIPDLVYSKHRVDRPHFREGWLRHRELSDGRDRGSDKFVPVSWDQALAFIADELHRVRDVYGHKSLFAGSYGWSSAGRFHHARTQTRRFFGALGGFTDQTGNYSWGAAQILLQNILGSADAVSGGATSWSTIKKNTDTLIAFGGLSKKNWNVTSGGAGNHHMPRHVQEAYEAGTQFIIISPMADDIPPGIEATWIAPRPGSDTAIMLALCYEMIRTGRCDRCFIDRYCVGFEKFSDYLTGASDGIAKTLEWAAAISDVPLPSLNALAERIATGRIMLTATWSLQRAHRGEQSYWALVALAAILGQIGLPGGGFTFGYGSLNAVGEGARKGFVPVMPTLGNDAGMTIPVARFAEMLEYPGKEISFDGASLTFPDIRLIYWAGGNPFHHAQDLFRLNRLWAKPETIIVHEQSWTATAMRADIVLPATTSMERNDISGTSRDPHVFFMPQLIDPVGEARNDYDIFSDLASHMNCHQRFTEGRSENEWLSHLWEGSITQAEQQGIEIPSFEELKAQNVWQVPLPDEAEILLSDFRTDPENHPLCTPSGKIEIACKKIEKGGYPDISGFPKWETPREWLGNANSEELALLSRQPRKFLHSQLSRTHLSGNTLPLIEISAHEAAKRSLENGSEVIVSSGVGRCLAILSITDGCRDGVAAMETGPHFIGGSDKLDAGGNPNALTKDFPTSSLSQATAAQSCLVKIDRWRSN